MDFNLSVLPALRPYDPVTEGEGILCFLEGSPHILPFSSSLLSMAYSWMVREGVPPRVQFYSAEEEQGKQSFVAAKPKKKADPPNYGQPGGAAPAAFRNYPFDGQPAEDPSGAADKVRDCGDCWARSSSYPGSSSGLFNPDQEPFRLEGLHEGFGSTTSDQRAFAVTFAGGSEGEGDEVGGGRAHGSSGSGCSSWSGPFDWNGTNAAVPSYECSGGPSHPPTGSYAGLGVFLSRGLSLSSKGTRGRERLLQELSAKNGAFFLQVAQNAFKRLRPAEAVPRSLQEFPKKAIFSKYLERQGGFASQKDIGITLWLLSQVADALLCQEPVHAQDLLALAIVSLEQVAQDGGKWELGYLLSLQEDPPQSLFSSRAPSTNPRLRAFAPLCPQPWTSVALTYLREMDIIATRRSEAASSSRSAAANAVEEPRPNPKRKPKFPKKPKEKEGS